MHRSHMHDNGKLLGCFGIGYHPSQGNDIAGIETEISEMHRVMDSKAIFEYDRISNMMKEI